MNTRRRGRIPISLPARPSPGITVSRLRRVLPRLRRRTLQQPWVWERLATPDEIDQLTKTDMRRAA